MNNEAKAEISHEALTGLLRSHVGVMERLSNDLAGLIADREDEFLALGANLMEFTSRSQDLVQTASALTELCSGEEVASNTEALSEELTALSGVCHSDEDTGGLVELNHVMGLLANLDGQITEFGRIIKSLSMLGISTRIESARLGDKGLGFSTLADDVETLASKIVEDSSAIAEKSKSLESLLESARHRTQNLLREQNECSEGIIKDIDKSLKSLNEMMDRSRSGADYIAHRSEAVAANVADVVSSLQFHDIVRQQVEHVEEALDDMVIQAGKAAQLDAPESEPQADAEPGEAPEEFGDEPDSETIDASADDAAGIEEFSEESEEAEERTGDAGEAEAVALTAADDAMKDVVGWVADVAELQISQLDNASKRFEAAVSGLREGLSGISGSAAEIGTSVNEILSAGETHGGGTVMEQVGKSTKTVLEAMHTFAKKSAEVSELIGSVAGTVAEMTEFVSNIEEVGAEIELIALNASIKAAHTGDEGKALGVLAQAIQRLSVEARDRTTAVSEVLHSISDASAALEKASDTEEKQRQVDQYAQRQTELMQVLDALSGKLSAAAGEVLALSSALGADMDRLVDGIRLDQDICPGLDAARDELRGLADSSRALVPVSDDVGRPARLKDLLSRYTMEAERLVHESAFGGGHGPVLNHEDEGEAELFDDVELFGDDEPAAATNGESGSSGEDDWDNVELF